MVDYLCLCLEDFFTIDDGGNEVGLAYLLNVVVQVKRLALPWIEPEYCLSSVWIE
jgi:hypothetical protein